MIQANLIPIPRRLARQRRTRVRRWATACTVYSIVLVAAYGALQAVWGHDDTVLEHDVVQVSGDISTTQKEVKVVQPRLNEARLTLAASLAVGSQPDWGALLALLAKAMQDDPTAAREAAAVMVASGRAASPVAVPVGAERAVQLIVDEWHRQIVLSGCELEPIRDVAPPTNATTTQTLATAQPKFTLRLSGMGRSPAAISRYVLRLEHTGLFDRVTLVESKRTPFAEGDAIAFRILCTLGESR